MLSLTIFNDASMGIIVNSEIIIRYFNPFRASDIKVILTSADKVTVLIDIMLL